MNITAALLLDMGDMEAKRILAAHMPDVKLMLDVSSEVWMNDEQLVSVAQLVTDTGIIPEDVAKQMGQMVTPLKGPAGLSDDDKGYFRAIYSEFHPLNMWADRSDGSDAIDRSEWTDEQWAEEVREDISGWLNEEDTGIIDPLITNVIVKAVVMPSNWFQSAAVRELLSMMEYLPDSITIFILERNGTVTRRLVSGKLVAVA